MLVDRYLFELSDLVQGGDRVEELEGNEEHGGDVDDEGGGDDGFNWTDTINGTTHQRPQGFLEDFLDR